VVLPEPVEEVRMRVGVERRWVRRRDLEPLIGRFEGGMEGRGGYGGSDIAKAGVF